MRTYTAQEIEELTNWYNANRQLLPASISFVQGEQITNVPMFVDHTLNIARRQRENSTFSRQIQYLFDLKAEIEKR